MRESEYAVYNTRTRTVVGVTPLTEDEAEILNRECRKAGSDIRLIPLSPLARTHRKEVRQ